jgi:NhaP-type Na+/H+ or K+/H+ antiporter/Trk K+ transport system NAD-binding subunit
VEGGHPALTLVLALAVGILSLVVARHLRVPGIVILLVAGVALGPDGLAWVDPLDLGDGLFAVVDLAVAVILFEGGLNLEISRLRREQAPIRRLVTVGVAVTTVGGALAVQALFDWPWMQALLFGSLVAVTGPTVIGPLVDAVGLRPRVATVLEAEGVLIDPVGAILAVLILEVALAPGTDALASGATGLVLRLGFGAASGILAGFALAGLLRVRRVVPEGYENVTVLASVLLLFEGCDGIVPQSGVLAVAVAGVVVGNARTRVDRDLREFKDQLSVLLIGLLFILLAATVRIEEVRALGWAGLAVVGVLVVAVRPLNVWLCTAGSELTRNERWFIAGISPRGIVAAAVASLAAGALESRGLAGGPELLAMVFLTIAGSVLFSGLLAGPLASLLGQRLPGRDTVAILGAQGLGLGLGEVLREAGTPVVFLDSNPLNCRQAQEAGFAVVFGDAVQERTLLRARPRSVGAAIGLTPNQMLNSVFVSRARERFGVPRGYVAVQRPESGLAPELVETPDVAVLFDGPHDVERWDVRWRHGSVEIQQWSYGGAPERAEGEAPPKVGERFVILALRRGGKIQPMHAKLKLQKGDTAAIAVHSVEDDEARETLRSLGWQLQPAEEAA